MLKETPLHNKHIELGAKMVDFGGWHMPLHYGSQIEEHHKVRQDAGFFDVSHMTIVDIQGKEAQKFLRYLLANDVAKLKEPGKALYSCMLNETGGVVDDLIAYYLTDTFYRLVINAATTEKDLAWMQAKIQNFQAELTQRKDLAMVAVQGPQAIAKLLKAFPQWTEKVNGLKIFQGGEVEAGIFVAKTGYTGEKGVEVMLPNENAVSFVEKILAQGIAPIGLGARDTLRLEAGMALYGHEMDEETTPLEAGLAWTLDFTDLQRDFIGRSALEAQKNTPHAFQHAFVLEAKGVLREGQKLEDNQGHQGVITSGTFSPTLGKAIALARLEANFDPQSAQVQLRKKSLPLKAVKAPFVRNGQVLVKVLG